MKTNAVKGMMVACMAALPVWADGSMMPGDYTQQWRNYAEDNGRGEVIAALDRYWCDRDTLPEEHEARREGLRAAVLENPKRVNDCERACGEPFSPLSAAVWLNDVEMVDFLLEHGAFPYGGSTRETEEMMNPAKTDPRIIESLRKAQRQIDVLEELVKAAEMPTRSSRACPHMQYDFPVQSSARGGFSRVPQAARYSPDYNSARGEFLVCLEGLVQQEEQGGAVAFAAVGLGVSEDGRLLSIDRRMLPEGAEQQQVEWRPLIVASVPYVFSIPRKDGGVSILTFNREAKTLTLTVLDKNGAPVNTESLCPRTHCGKVYKRGTDGRTITEGFELPAAEVLLYD